MDTSGMDKHTPGQLAMMAVVFSCIGGMSLELGIDRLMNSMSDYHWIGSFLIGVAFVTWASFVGYKLARRFSPTR